MSETLPEPSPHVAGEPVFTDALAQGVRTRDPDALAWCYEALADALFRYVRGLCGDPVLAEDLVEETFLELVEYAPALTGGLGGLRAWLFRAARNNLIDARRKSARRGDVPWEDDFATQRPDSDPGPELQTLHRERGAVLETALAQLSEDQREVVLLRFLSGLSGPEVAAATGRSVGAVKSLQHRGLAALARVLGTDQDLRDFP
ncbi:MAG TPA: RNA polymerase sigma factor [Egibacteraceae bacterium]|nr:RNA polymerase sigma factor [Egibacteraceae bacterium]